MSHESNHVHHHVRASRRRERRRFVVDILIVVAIIFLLSVVLYAHLSRQRALRESHAELARLSALFDDRRQPTQEVFSSQGGVIEPGVQTTSSGVDGGVETAENVAIESTEDVRSIPAPLPIGSATSTSEESATTVSIEPYPAFEDVTSVRYDNSRLGFIMELPSGWNIIYERGEDIAISDAIAPFGASLEDVVALPKAMWIHIARPCAPQEASGTIFHFSTSSDNLIRDATSCIAPFMVTLGYRADVPDAYAREVFLLSLGRTFYPMVSPIAPYPPIR